MPDDEYGYELTSTRRRSRGAAGALAARAATRLLRLPPATAEAVRVVNDLRVPMRDGVQLLADLYLPAGGRPRPTLLVRNLYGWDLPIGFLYGRLYAARGYQVLVQRCRGTFGSGGALEPWVREAEDGQDTARWIEKQGWYSGGFATIGASYLGYAQWALLSDPPPGLRGAVVQMGPHEYQRVAWPGGAFALDTMAGWASMISHPKRGPVRDTLRQLREKRRLGRIAYRELPLSESCDRALGREYPHLGAWLEHEDANDPYWTASDHTAVLAAGAPVPVLLQGNWYDAFLGHTLEQYALLTAAGTSTRLTIGPWTHTAIAKWWPTFMADSLSWLADLFPEFSPPAPPRPEHPPQAAALEPRTPPVRLFLLGADTWAEFPTWPPPQAVAERWHLHPGGRLDREPPAEPDGADQARNQPTHYHYNPSDPTPAVGGAWTGATAGPRDNRQLEDRLDVVTFTSDPLIADLDVVGELSAELHVRSSRPSTDFFVRLCDVRPDGRSTDITDGLLRVRPGKPQSGSNPVLRLEVALAPTACRFRAGHRIRVQISSGAHPRYARNPGGVEPTASALGLYPADQQIFHDRERPSSITLSVIRSL